MGYFLCYTIVVKLCPASLSGPDGQGSAFSMFKQAKAGLLLSSAAYLILGVCLIGWPDLSVSLL